MPYWPSSIAADFISPRMPHLEAEYELASLVPCLPCMEESTMMRPYLRSTMCGAKARIVLAVPFRLLSITSRQSRVLHLQQRHPALDRGIGDDDVDLAEILARSASAMCAQRADVADVGAAPACSAGRTCGCRRGLVEFGLGSPACASEAGLTGPQMSTATMSAPFAAIRAQSPGRCRGPRRSRRRPCPASALPRPGWIGPALGWCACRLPAAPGAAQAGRARIAAAAASRPMPSPGRVSRGCPS